MIEPPPAEFWIKLPYTRPPLSLNDRSHWANSGRAKAALKADTRVLARSVKLPTAAERAKVTLIYNPPDKRRRDTDNLFATLKPCLDGLIDYGLTADDDSTHIESACAIGEIRKPGQVWLKIEVTS